MASSTPVMNSMIALPTPAVIPSAKVKNATPMLCVNKKLENAAWACTDGFSTAQTDADWRVLVGNQLRDMLMTTPLALSRSV